MADFILKCFKILPLLILISCSGGEVDNFSIFETFDDDGILPQRWYTLDIGREFSKNLPEPVKYNVDLNVRYTKNYPYENLMLDIEETGCSSDTLLKSSITIPLYSKGDKTKYNGYGLYETTYHLHSAFPIDSLYIFNFCTPVEKCEGIKSVGIVLKK